jgi:hypothetical protein
MILQIHPKAEHELKAAARWYEKQSEGLEIEFFATVDAAMAGIETNPDRATRLETWRGEGDVRRVALPRFPDLIVDEVIQDVIHIWSIAHSNRKPNNWKSRRRSE